MSVKRVTLMLFGDDSQLKRVLDEIERRKKEIGKNIKIKVEGDSAATIAQLAEIKRLLDEIQRKKDEIKLGGLLGRLGGAGGGGTGGLGNNSRGGILGFIRTTDTAVKRLIERIPGIGGALAAIPSPVALIAITAAAVALAAAIGSVIGNLAAAGLGLGSLAALALPSIKAIQKGVHDVGKETTALGRNKALQAVPAAFRPAVKDIVQMKAAWMDMSKSIEPLIGRIIKLGTSIGKTLLPILKPFAESAGHALEGLLRQFDKVTQSQGFKSFLNTMLKFSGPAITALGQGLGQVLGALADELKQLTDGKSLIVLKATFLVLATTIRAVGQALKFAINWTFTLGNAFLRLAHVGVSTAKTVGDAWLSVTSGTLHFMSHIPGLGFLKGWGDAVDKWKKSFDGSMNGALGKIDQWRHALQNAPKIMTLQANIQNLMSRLETARDALKDPNLTKTRRARIEANISNLLRNIAIAKAQLAGLDGSSATVFVDTVMANVGAGVGVGSGSGAGNGGGHPKNAPGSTTGPNASIGGSWSTGGSGTMGSDAIGGHGPHHDRHGRRSHRGMRRIFDPIMTPGGPFIGEHFRHTWLYEPIPRHHHHRDHHGRGGAQVVINFNGVVTDPNATAKKVQTMLLDLKRSRGGGDLGLA